MKTKITFFTSAFSILFLMACGNSQDEITETNDGKDSLICIMPEPLRIQRASWLVGEWEHYFEGGRMYEAWTMVSDSLFTGVSYTLENDDTVQYESVQLIQRGADVFYIPTVDEQNGGEPVEFKLTAFTDSTLVFENPLHEFPQKIYYINYGGDSLLAEISGLYEGEPGLVQFPLKRIK